MDFAIWDGVRRQAKTLYPNVADPNSPAPTYQLSCQARGGKLPKAQARLVALYQVACGVDPWLVAEDLGLDPVTALPVGLPSNDSDSNQPKSTDSNQPKSRLPDWIDWIKEQAPELYSRLNPKTAWISGDAKKAEKEELTLLLQPFYERFKELTVAEGKRLAPLFGIVLKT